MVLRSVRVILRVVLELLQLFSRTIFAVIFAYIFPLVAPLLVSDLPWLLELTVSIIIAAISTFLLLLCLYKDIEYNIVKEPNDRFGQAIRKIAAEFFPEKNDTMTVEETHRTGTISDSPEKHKKNTYGTKLKNDTMTVEETHRIGTISDSPEKHKKNTYGTELWYIGLLAIGIGIGAIVVTSISKPQTVEENAEVTRSAIKKDTLQMIHEIAQADGQVTPAEEQFIKEAQDYFDAPSFLSRTWSAFWEKLGKF